MRREITRSKIHTLRFNSLHKKKKKDSAPVYTQRPSLGEAEYPKVKQGYEFLHKPPYFNHSAILELISNGVIMHNINLKKSILALRESDPDSIFKAEKIIQDMWVEMAADSDCSRSTGVYEGEEHPFQGKPHIKRVFRCPVSPAGSFTVREAVETNQRSFLIGIALIYHCLGIYPWYLLPVDEDVDNTMQYGLQGRMDMQEDDLEVENRSKKHEKTDVENWENSTGALWLYAMNHEVMVQDVKKAKKRWKRGESLFKKQIGQIMAGFDFDFIERVIAEKTDLGLWYRGILYLIINNFKLLDYKSHDDDELPVEYAFSILWDNDDYLAAWDEYSNSQSEAGMMPLSYSIEYYENGVVKLPQKDHMKLMEVFTCLFYYNHIKQTFYDAQNTDIRACLSSISIHKWERILHRAIKNSRKRRMV